MPIYRQTGSNLLPIKEKKIELERTVQLLVEKNLDDIFRLSFVCSEFPLNGLRIDTLAFDDETNAFVIIEYKRDRSFSVIDQGYAYLSLLLNNKADFVLEYNERNQKSLRKDEIDWSQSKVIFIASSFTKYQQEAIGFQDLPIELWEIKQFDNDLILFNELRASEKSESIKTVVKDKKAQAVSREIKQYSVQDHFQPNWETTKVLYEVMSQRILELDSRIEITPTKNYIGFKIDKSIVVALNTRSTKLILDLPRVQPEDLRDPDGRTKYVKGSFENWNKHLTRFEVENEEDIDYGMMLARQVYKNFFSF